MKKLTSENFNRARDFLLTQARPLEKALFAMEFEGGSLSEVLSELNKFQNPDGGFGQALEPDLRTPTSSALCTEMGLRYLAERSVPEAHLMVTSAVAYLLDTFDADFQVWRVIPADANAHPHAPWWHDQDGSLAQTFDDYRVIPQAGILASLYHYTERVPADWLAEVTEKTVNDILSLDKIRFGGGGDTLVYALRLLDAPGLEPRFKSRLEPFLFEVADEIVTRDTQAWSGYAIPPLKLAPTPSACLADLLADDLQVYLDYLIERQTSDGTWKPTWNWGENFPETWEQAHQEWRGILTLDNLIALRLFGRLSG